MILTVTNVAKDIINIFYVRVYDMDQLDRNDNILTIGVTLMTCVAATIRGCSGGTIMMEWVTHPLEYNEIHVNTNEYTHLNTKCFHSFISLRPCYTFNSLTAKSVPGGTKNYRPVGFYSRNSTKSTLHPNTTIPQI